MSNLEEFKLTGESKDIVSENISKLKEIFPDIFEDGKINFDKLKSNLGEYVDDTSERYNFIWPGKSEANNESQKRSTGTLRPCKEESKNWDTTQNLYIEGDNLEVLKLLQKGYFNKIKMIYIDPPYNTGNDFIYSDNYQDNLENYLKISGQSIDSDNSTRKVMLTTNTESQGRYHSNWLNMMYPRLKLARNLLTDDGVIFISIDDNEIDNLKKICNEIFGENNFITQFFWKSRTSQNYSDKYISNIGEYILCYANNLNYTKEFGKDKSSPTNYTNPDNDPNGPWVSSGIIRDDGRKKYEVTSPTGKKHYEAWLYTEDNFNKLNEEGRIWWGRDGTAKPRKKSYLKDWDGNPYTSLIISKDITTEKGTNEVKKLFNAKYFDYPKPISLLLNLLEMNNSDECYVLDFFSGSASFAHAVMEFNNKNNVNNKFILIQIPEETNDKSTAYKDGYVNICEIGKERIRLAGDKIIEESGNKDLDVGFKVFKLDSSNLEKWDPDYKNIRESLIVDNIKPDRTKEDLIYEIMLKYGMDLTWPIQKENNIYSIGFGALIICLEDSITQENTKEITNHIIKLADNASITRVVFKDSSFNNKDSVKTNIKEIFSNNGIEKFITI